MKNYKPVFLLIFFFVSVGLLLAQNQQQKILFIGNSITYFNDMPILFQEIANSKGKNIAVQSHAPGGTGFIDHVVSPTVYNLFKNNVWDAVVLQPGSGESAGATSSVNLSISRGQIIIDSIKKYSPCAKIFLYQIPYGVPSASTYNTYFNIQTRIRDSVTKMSDALRVPLVPAGECTRMHYAAQQDLLLHSSFNDIHPNLNGSYLVAAAMFAAIFQENAAGSNFLGGVAPTNANYFQNIADNVVLNNKPLWRINTYNLNADFDFVANQNNIDFVNNSVNYDNLIWDFGDGSTSDLPNPSHVYATVGSKTVTLIAIKNGCQQQVIKNITIGSLSVNVFQKNSAFDIVYNSAEHFLSVKTSDKFIFTILDIIYSSL